MIGKKGLFIVFEGITSTGKSTHVKQLRDHLKSLGKKVLINDEPTQGFWGRVIRAVIENKNSKFSEIERQSIFIRDRADDLRDTIRPVLKKGYIILQDRYELSTFAHGLTSGLSFEVLDRLEKELLGKEYLKPDYTIFLDIDPKTSIKRLKKSKKRIDIYESLKQTTKIHDNYKKLIKMKKRFGKIIVIDAHGSIDEVYKKLLRKFKQLGIT